MQDKDNLEQENQENEDSDKDNSSKDPLIMRYKHQVKGSQAEALKLKQELESTRKEKINIAAERIESDPEYMKTLYARDPNFANEVAKQFEGYESAEQLMKEFLGESIQQDSSKKSFADRIAEKVLAEISQKSTLSQIDQKFSHLDEDSRKVAKEKFEAYRAGRNLTPDQATELSEMITLHLQKDVLVTSAKQSQINAMGNLKLGGVSITPTGNENSGAGLAEVFGLQHLYTNQK